MMAREQNLETLQAQYADFRRRAEPGLTHSDLYARLDRAVNALEIVRAGDTGAILGEMLIDLCCLAAKEQLDLAHHARRAFLQMQRDYEAGQ
jgi:hypothetical protein